MSYVSGMDPVKKTYMRTYFCRVCRLWSAPYDGINPPPQEYRADTPADDIDDEEEFIQRVESDSITSLVISPPPSALSPTPSSLDNCQAGRAGSALELEWDDIFADENPLSSAVGNVVPANGAVSVETDGCNFPPAPPRHIQEMRRNATKLVHGSYVEESEFQDDVLVYDLVAKKDAKAAILDRIMVANRRSHGSISKGQRQGTTTMLTTMLTTTGRTVIETVNNIMLTRRRSEDGGREERRRSEDCGKETWRTKEGEEEEAKRIFGHRGSLGDQLFTNGYDVNNPIIGECDEADDDIASLKRHCELNDFTAQINLTTTAHQQHSPHSTQSPLPCLVTNTLINGYHESEPCDLPVSPSLPDSSTNNNGFLSQYRELMLSLGVEPDCEDITDGTDTFSKRVQVLRQKLEDDEGELCTDFIFSSSWDDAEEEREEEVMEEDEEEEESQSNIKKGSRRHGVPFTGLCLCGICSSFTDLLR